jgi:hypothetical protein
LLPWAGLPPPAAAALPFTVALPAVNDTELLPATTNTSSSSSLPEPTTGSCSLVDEVAAAASPTNNIITTTSSSSNDSSSSWVYDMYPSSSDCSNTSVLQWDMYQVDTNTLPTPWWWQRVAAVLTASSLAGCGVCAAGCLPAVLLAA